MKKILFVLALALILMGCTKEESIILPDSYTITGYSNTLTKTDFGTPGANSIPFVWSEGDKIWSGTKESSAAEIHSHGGATFTFTSEPAGTVYYNMTGESPTAAWIPVVQDASKSLGENGDFGYAEIQDGTFVLNHATAYIWFNLKSLPSGAVLKSIRIHSGKDIIAGSATFGGSGFTVTDGRSIIELKTNISSPTTGADAVMVVYPGTVSSATVTYQFAIGNDTRYYEQTLSSKTLEAGKTYKIDADLSGVALKEYVLRTLTFEDNHTMFDRYSITGYESSTDSYYDHFVSVWTALIDSPEYGGPLTYGDMGFNGEMRGCDYNWYDYNNTFIASEFPVNYGSRVYWGGGHIVSHYASEDYTTYGTYEHQQCVYGTGEVYGETLTGGNGNSKNFGIHYGYIDGSDYNKTEVLPYIYFKDNVERVIDHMYVNNSCYAISCYMDGNGLTVKIGPNDWSKVTATGYDLDGNATTCDIYLCNGPDNIVTEWTKWDLSSLGAVVKVEFNILGTSDNSYGYSQPSYFAYDDLAVRF